MEKENEEQIRRISVLLASAYWRGKLEGLRAHEEGERELAITLHASEDASKWEAAARFGLS